MLESVYDEVKCFTKPYFSLEEKYHRLILNTKLQKFLDITKLDTLFFPNQPTAIYTCKTNVLQ